MNLSAAFETFAAGQVAGQQINADLQAKRDDHELRQQQLAQAKQTMAMQARAQEQEQKFAQQRAGIIADYDAKAAQARVAEGADPDTQEQQRAQQEVNLYRDIGKAALLTNPAVAQQYFALADSSAAKAAGIQKTNLEISEKKAKDTAAFAGSVLAGGVDPTTAYEWVVKNVGLKEAMSIPTDPAKAKLYWQSKQRQGMTAAEQVANETKVAEFDQTQKRLAKEADATAQDRLLRRQELAASRDANLEIRKQSLELAKQGLELRKRSADRADEGLELRKDNAQLSREKFEEGGTVQHQRNIAAVEYGSEIARNLKNVTSFAASTNGALFQGVPGGTSILGALQGNTTNKLTPEGEQMLKVAMGGMGLEMGQLMTSSGGRGVTQTLINELHEMMAYRSSDTPATKMFKMANAAELARVRLEATPEPRSELSKKKREEALAALREYPTPAQIIEVAQRKGQKIEGAQKIVTMRDQMKRAIAGGEVSGPPADVADLLNKYK